MNDRIKKFDWRVAVAAMVLAVAIPTLALSSGYSLRGEYGLTLLTHWAQGACIFGCALGAIGLTGMFVWLLLRKQWISAIVIAPLVLLSPLIGFTLVVFSSHISLSKSALEGADEKTYRVMSYGFMDIEYSLVREFSRNPVFVTVEKVATQAPLSDECQMLEAGDSFSVPGLLATIDRRVIMLKLGNHRCVQAAYDVESQTAWGGPSRSIHYLPTDILSSPGAIDTVVPRLPRVPARYHQPF